MATPTKKTAEKMAEKMGTLEVDRRQFLTTTAVVGGGLMLGFWLPRPAAAATVAAVSAEPWYRAPMVPEINAWMTIGPDDTVTIRINQVGRYAISIEWSDGHKTGIYTFEHLREIDSSSRDAEAD